MGFVPNVLATMAHSPAVLRAYVKMNEAFAAGRFSESERERIHLAISEGNGCHYCVSAHTAAAQQAGLSEGDARRARRGEADDARLAGALRFVRALVDQRGWAGEKELEQAREAGLDEGDIVELIGLVALNTLTNYTNHVAETEIDFPKVAPPDAGTS